MTAGLDTSSIKDWRSIVTLIVFVFTNIVVLYPIQIPVYIPRRLCDAAVHVLSAVRLIQPRHDHEDDIDHLSKRFVKVDFPLNYITAPLLADLFLLAILAIGRQEVYDGIIGADNISPLNIMVFFISLAYIAISIDASGLLRYLAFKVLQKGAGGGRKLFLFLYSFFFALGSFIGNDPIILSGTPFLAYMTKASSNIIHPRAWVHSQFAVANIASAILVSSNPTNLVLAGAFRIKFIDYTANMIVPVVGTVIILFPFLLYIVFSGDGLIPISIKMHELSEEAKARTPINPNIPQRQTADSEHDRFSDPSQGELRLLEEIMNPFLDKWGAAFGAGIMATTLIIILALNAASQRIGSHPVFWVTLPAAFVMFCWNVGFEWYRRHENREIVRNGRNYGQEAQPAPVEQEPGNEEENKTAREQIELFARLLSKSSKSPQTKMHSPNTRMKGSFNDGMNGNTNDDNEITLSAAHADESSPSPCLPPFGVSTPRPSKETDCLTLVSIPSRAHSTSNLGLEEDQVQNVQHRTSEMSTSYPKQQHLAAVGLCDLPEEVLGPASHRDVSTEEQRNARRQIPPGAVPSEKHKPSTLSSIIPEAWKWMRETFPTTTAVFVHLPLPLVPFSLSMFVLVQSLVAKGWVPVFAYGWDKWVNKTGAVGSISAMGFLSVILCNFAGTNIGTSILLCRVIQAWQEIHRSNGLPISDRIFWGTVYAMALGLNYGAFSTAFSASLAGLLWRDILLRRKIRVSGLEFARVNLPIIAIAMAVGSAILLGEVYVVRSNSPYHS